MRTLLVLALVSLLALAESARPNRLSRGPRVPPVKPQYRISPIDNTSIIALPTPELLAWQDQEISVLIHFNIATYIDINDGCNGYPSLLPNISSFNPVMLSTDNWIDAIANLGAKYATLVTKHNCGFTTWPTNVTFPTVGGPVISYNYSIANSPLNGTDVVRNFIDSCNRANIRTGFYYSVNVNNFLNIQNFLVYNKSWVPGQVNITNEVYDTIIVKEHLTELWTQYGELDEIWFDGGYSAEQIEIITGLLQRYQPHAVIFNGCAEDGGCVSNHSVRWVGNEYGVAPDPNWSTGITNDGGDPNSPIFAPAECDTTLQTNDRWFWGSNTSLRTISQLIDVYHTTVGRNCVLEMDLTPDRNGLIPAAYAARYKQLGDFIRSCYGTSVPNTGRVNGTLPGVYIVDFSHPVTIDRIMLMEDQTNGQVIRSYYVSARVVDAGADHGQIGPGLDVWTPLSRGTSVGHKKIDIFDASVTVTSVRVSTTYVDIPVFRSITVHLCDTLESSAAAASVAALSY